jgi:isopentenyl-diphosphate delta-isomerase
MFAGAMWETTSPSAFEGKFAMSEEWFDVVDEQDQIVGTCPRSQVHRRRLLHRAIHVFLFRPNGEILIHKRSASKEEFPSVWTSSCSGHVSSGDGYPETARRELLEELGIETDLRELQKFAACPETSMEFSMLYAGVSNRSVRPDPNEITEICWLTPMQISDWIVKSPQEFSPAFLLLFRWFMAHNAV